MNVRAGRRLPLWVRACFALCLGAALLVSGCAALTFASPTTAPTTAPKTAPAVGPTAAGAAEAESAPQTPGETIALETGGALFVPEGALPQGTQIEAYASAAPPLPDDVKPVGQALAILADARPSQPVTLWLPIPEGAADPEKLAIVRSATDGGVTFLMTEVLGEELVAASPGLSSVFTTVEVPVDQKAVIVGSKVMEPGSRTSLYVPFAPTQGSEGAAYWSVGSLATIIYESSNTVILEAGDKEGGTVLSYECVDVAGGKRWFGSIVMNIAKSRVSSLVPFSVSVVTHTPIAHPGQPVSFVASVQGQPEFPLMWRWDFSGEKKGWPTPTEGNVRTFEQIKIYDPASLPERFNVVVTVEDDLGRTASGTVLVLVTKETMHVALGGPERLEWHDGGSSSAYDASVTGGKPPYRYTWQLWPGGDAREITDFASDAQSASSSELFIFQEPGGYELEVTVTDADRKTAKAVLPIVVDGGEALTASLLNFPSTAKVGQDLEVYAQMRGGVATVAGKKVGYKLTVIWGDGKAPLDKDGVGTALSSAKGMALITHHTYDEPGTFTARIVVVDAARNAAYKAYEIVVTEDGAEPVPTAAGRNWPPVVVDLVISTEKDTSVPVTLKARDIDGDDLTYTVVTNPAQGTLSGEAPFLTYAPRAGYSGSDRFTYRVNDGKTDSKVASVSISVTTADVPVRWVRSGEAAVNGAGEPREFYGNRKMNWFDEARFEGKHLIYDVTETRLAIDEVEMDGGYEYFAVTMATSFDTPPAELIPGETYELKARFSKGGTVTQGNPGVRFQYGADRNHSSMIKPGGPFSYYPWQDNYDGQDEATWTLEAPRAMPGYTLEVWAGWWNCSACNVTWTYVAE